MEAIELDLAALQQGRDNYSILCGDAAILLKRMSLSAERLQFIHNAKEYMDGNGFSNIDHWLDVNGQGPFFKLGEAFYTASRKPARQRECDFDRREDIGEAAETLGRMHRAGRGFRQGMDVEANNSLGKLPAHFRHRYEEMRKLYRQAKKGHSQFDFMFAEQAPVLFEQCERAIDGLDRSAYSDIVAGYQAEPVLCHHDYTYQNLCWDGPELKVLNFDYCCYELKVYDVANLLRRKMRKCNWRQEEAGYILSRYRTAEPISPEEFEVMKLILQFPQKYWRVLNRYYNSRKSWAEKGYIVKLREVAEELEFSAQFLDNLSG